MHLGLAALSVRTRTQPALFAVAATALGFLLVGIHNAWDTVTHIVVKGSPEMDPRISLHEGVAPLIHLWWLDPLAARIQAALPPGITPFAPLPNF